MKVKVGDDLERELASLAILRRLLGPTVDLRVDANCAWTRRRGAGGDRAHARVRDQRRRAAARRGRSRRSRAGSRPRRRRRSSSTSRCAPSRRRERSSRRGACNAFNVRVSKCGGLLASMRIARIARRAGLDFVVGAQVGESGLLSAAGRHLAAAIGSPRYVEGSGGSLLLKEDLTVERVLPGYGGWAQTLAGPGLGVRVRPDVLERHTARARRSRRGGKRVARTSPMQRLIKTFLDFSDANRFDDATWKAARGAGGVAARDREAERGHRLRARARLRRDPLDRGLPGRPCRRTTTRRSSRTSSARFAARRTCSPPTTRSCSRRRAARPARRSTSR